MLLYAQDTRQLVDRVVHGKEYRAADDLRERNEKSTSQIAEYVTSEVFSRHAERRLEREGFKTSERERVYAADSPVTLARDLRRILVNRGVDPASLERDVRRASRGGWGC